MKCVSFCDDVYRLSDLVNGYWGRHFRGQNFTEHVCKLFPESIGCAWMMRGDPHRDVCDLVPRRNRSEHVLHVHLRLGDVIEYPYYRLHRGCADAERGCTYLRPLNDYRTVSLPRAITHAVLVSNVSYRTRGHTAYGREYRMNVSRILTGRGLRVAFESPSADEALARLVNARYLMPGRGGFASLARRCAQKRGTEIVG